MNLSFILSIFPIVLLIWMMTKKKALPSYQALPLTAVIMYLIMLIHFGTDPTLVHATALDGILTAWTPILIVWGAIFLFRTMEYSGAMDDIRKWLKSITDNRTAQLMIIGWAFVFLIEGASGFGTPAALAAPILVALGFPAVRAAILCLIMDTLPVSFGAVGTPTWFGFSELGLSQTTLLEIGFQTALIHAAASLVIPVLGLSFVIPWKEIRRNLIFVYLSIASCMVPYVLLARINYEFPAIAGGFIGLILSVLLAKKGIGLAAETEKSEIAPESPSFPRLIKASFPLWGTVLILVITRIKELGLRDPLNIIRPAWEVPLGSLGQLGLSPALALRLENIFGTSITWIHKTLYVPSFIPFILVSVIAFALFQMKGKPIKRVWNEAASQIKRPAIALMGALVFVKLLMMESGDSPAPAILIGRTFADWAGVYWQFASPFLGALGSFFSGSNTVSNLTFGGIQYAIAQDLGLDTTAILAMQSVGGAMGNMVCIHNIVAVCSVLGLPKEEGFILKRTALPLLIYGIIAGITGMLLI